MSVIIIDGPEKAGKSTLASALKLKLMSSGKYNEVVIRHQTGRAVPDDSIYSEQLSFDTSKPAKELVAIWDRGWPSEFVYGTLMNQDRRLASDPWLGEWIHGRSVSANGLKIILPGPKASTLLERRDRSDLPVSPVAERASYLYYGKRFNWMVLPTSTSEASTDFYVDMIINRFEIVTTALKVFPPLFGGSVNSEVIFIGEDRAGSLAESYGWLPFSNRAAMELGRVVGDYAVSCGWTNAHDCPPEVLRAARILVPCGTKAQKWVTSYVNPSSDQRVIPIKHPTHLFRTGATSIQRESANQIVSNILKELDNG